MLWLESKSTNGLISLNRPVIVLQSVLREELKAGEILENVVSLFCLLSQFSKEVLANIYSAYIDNFLNAKDAVRIAKEAKPAFMKFLEVSFSALPSEGTEHQPA